MAGTWLLEGTRERLSVQRAVTKTQTHALYAIRPLLIKSARRSQVGAGRQSSCDVFFFSLSQQGGWEILLQLWSSPGFSTGNCGHRWGSDRASVQPAILTLGTDSSPPLAPFIPQYTSGVSEARGRGRRAQPVLNPAAARESQGAALSLYS